MSDGAVPTCACGHGVGHGSVSGEPRYGFGALLTMMLGVTGRPKRVDFICRSCGEIVARSVDPAVIRDHTS